MKLVTFVRPAVHAHPEPGLVIGESVWSLAGAGFPDLLSIIREGAAALARIEEFVRDCPVNCEAPLHAVELLAPIPRPPKLICVGLNYRDHAQEARMEIPQVPTIFSKFSSCVIGPGANIVLPKNSTRPDYEAEFAFVIGEGGRHIAAENWQRHVIGYTNVNDVSARDFQMATSQWLIGKTFDTFAPMGPWLVTADEISDPHNLDVRCTLNGELMQNSNTQHLIFRIPVLLAYLSSVFTLEPGDVVSTGTPAGVGFARRPPRFLRPGDEVVVEVSGLGALRNPVVAEV